MAEIVLLGSFWSMLECFELKRNIIKEDLAYRENVAQADEVIGLN